MWPAAYSWLYYFGIGVHVFVAAFIGQKLRLRQHVPIMVSVCYALAMTAGAKILSELHDGRFSSHGLLQRMHDNPAGLWGGPMIYLVLAVPVAIAMTRRQNAEKKAETPKAEIEDPTPLCPPLGRGERRMEGCVGLRPRGWRPWLPTCAPPGHA